MSRVAQYQRYLTADLEMLRTLYQYRTPMMLRYGCAVLIHVFAILLAPYFQSFCATWAYAESRCPAGYLAAILFVTVTMLMYSIQAGLEQPFDMQASPSLSFPLAPYLQSQVPAADNCLRVSPTGVAFRCWLTNFIVLRYSLHVSA